jgi:tRNA-2-methylthio-N6-dimethylallyladenosine synthase
MNEYDSDKISDLMQSVNFVRSETLEDVDCIIFNTCHIREKATEKVYSDIGKIKKLNRSKKKPIFVLAGCIAQAQGEEIFKRTNYVDIVVHNLTTDYQSRLKILQKEKKIFLILILS